MRYTVAPTVVSLCLAAAACTAQGPARSERPEYWAFTAPWDPASDSSVARHSGSLDAVVTGWIALDSASARPFVTSELRDTQRLPRTTRRFAIVTSWHNDRFHPTSVRALATRPALLGEAARWIAEHAAANGYAGLVLDLEELEPRDLQAQLLVTRAIRDSARARGVGMLATAIPAANSASYPARALLDVSDFILLMLYDQHWLTSQPGPISAPDWVTRSLTTRVAEAGGPDRIVAALPLYGYRWKRNAPTEIVSFTDARRISSQTGTPLQRDAATFTLRAQRTPEWDMWVTDVGLLKRLIADVRSAGVSRIAFWRMGQEDAAVWGMLSR
jgi:spore germination protein YaaH